MVVEENIFDMMYVDGVEDYFVFIVLYFVGLVLVVMLSNNLGVGIMVNLLWKKVILLLFVKKLVIKFFKGMFIWEFFLFVLWLEWNLWDLE